MIMSWQSYELDTWQLQVTSITSWYSLFCLYLVKNNNVVVVVLMLMLLNGKMFDKWWIVKEFMEPLMV